MRVILGEEGVEKTHQEKFPTETKCCRCEGISRIAFVAHETGQDQGPYVCQFKPNDDGLWIHDCCVVAIYFCKNCLEPTALYNQL